MFLSPQARPTVLLPALYMQNRQKTPLVMDWCDWFGRGGSVEERPNWLVRTLLRPVETFFEEQFRTRAIGTTVICSTLYQKAIELGVPSETILRLRDGADVEGLQPLPLKKCRLQLGLSNNLLLIGYVGAIFRRDAWLMAQAFDQIYAQLPQARLLLIGYVNQPLEQMVNAPHAVIRSGVLDYSQLNAYIAACNVCWLPYCNSGANQGRWPLKLNDYMAVGRATIATAVGDVTEVMQTHDIGILVEVSAEELAFKTLALLDAPEEYERLGQNARVVAEKFFDWRIRAEKIEDFYEHILVKCEI